MRRLAGTLVLALALNGGAAAAETRASRDLARYVNPFSGTAPGAQDYGTGGGAGNTFPGPVLPFGMIQWGPDTSPASANAGGGYAYGDTRIRGFSVRRLSGAGCANGGEFPFTPTTAPIDGSPVPPLSTEPADRFVASFGHTDEHASPGFYRVGLNPGTPDRIDARLTATRRAGIARLTFPAGAAASVLINAGGGRTGAADADVRIDPARHEVTGSTSTGGFCLEPNHYRIHFAARFSRPFAAHGTWTRQALARGAEAAHDTSPLDLLAADEQAPGGFARDSFTAVGGSGPTAQAGAYVTFDTTTDRTVEVRVAISFVSVDGARRNLDAELGGRRFAAVRAAARRAWNRMLRRIEVRGGRRADRRTFYSMLYHALVAPTTFSDADGRYAGMDGRVHRADGYTQYADFSGWDVYRSQMPLLALIAPRRASDLVRSLLADQRQSGWLPQWSIANAQTEVMTGDPAAPAIAGIWALGARRFDLREALAAMVKGATQPGAGGNGGYVERQAIEDYQRLGYVPHERNANLVTVGADAWRRAFPAPGAAAADLVWGSAGTTLEYAVADFAVARMAAAAGDPLTCRTFLRRAGNWRSVLDRSIGSVRPRWASGAFVAPYDPNASDPLSSQGFAEGDGAQYTWMVPHDPAGLFAVLGGREAAAARLDAFFAELNAGPSSPHAFLGNEPNSNAPWLYDWLGRPARTQDVVRRAILSMFDAGPGGYPGNDDLGQMSAWYVFGALGLYPAIPGSDVLALGSPLFPRAVLRLGGRRVWIVAPRAKRQRPYVHGLVVDGRRWRKPWLRLARIADGGRLTFSLGRTPDPTWGTAASAAPPSYGSDAVAACTRR
jgi:predicted alpha-1,2-mannosidase